MAKKSKGKVRVIPPNKKEKKDASKQLKKGHSSAAWTMDAAKAAKKQGVKRRSSGKRR